jgi:hypothetical protein
VIRRNKNMEEIITESKQDGCIGLLWKGKTSKWMSDGKIHSRTTLSLLKRRSCSGCPECEWIEEFLREDISLMSEKDTILHNIEHNKLYRIKFYFSRDFETGYGEIDDYEFEEVNDGTY